MFSQRVVGLELGSVVYDGKPEGLTPEVLTKIYGEEDWSATIKSTDEDEDENENEDDFQS
jgi:phosphonate transport system ATP-binding protein